jgi:hypothetical protein
MNKNPYLETKLNTACNVNICFKAAAVYDINTLVTGPVPVCAITGVLVSLLIL